MDPTFSFKDIRCVVFDFDGVILNSSVVKTECFRKLYKQYPDIYEKAMAYHFEKKGMSRFHQFEYVAKNLMTDDDPNARIKEMTEKFAELVFDEVSKTSYIPGAPELIKYLNNYFPLYIISSAPHDELERIIKIRQLEAYFKAYYGSVDNKEIVLNQILENENLQKASVLYVGDTLKDMYAAEKAGVAFCGVLNPLVDFSACGCLLVSDLNKLKDRFKSVFN